MDNNNKLRLCAGFAACLPVGKETQAISAGYWSARPRVLSSEDKRACTRRGRSRGLRPPGQEPRPAGTRPLPRRELTEGKPGEREASRGRRGVGLRCRKRALPRRLSEDDEHGRGARARLRSYVCSAPRQAALGRSLHGGEDGGDYGCRRPRTSPGPSGNGRPEFQPGRLALVCAFRKTLIIWQFL